MEKIFRRIADGRGRMEDLALIDSVCEQIGGHTICAFGDTMVLPFRSFIKKFRAEFEARIKMAPPSPVKSPSVKSSLSILPADLGLGAERV